MKANRNHSVWAYCRVSTDSQDSERQRLQIFEYANQKGWKIEHFVEATMSSKKDLKKRQIDMILIAASQGKIKKLLFAELSRLGRSVGEIARLVDDMISKGIELHFIQEGMVLSDGSQNMQSKIQLTMFSLFAEMERMLISERTKQGLAAAKATGKRIGRPPGFRKLLKDKEQIVEWLNIGVTQTAICRHMKCHPDTLNRFLKEQKLK